MAIRSVVTRGYGSGGSIALVVTRGYAAAAAEAPETSTGGWFDEMWRRKRQREYEEEHIPEQVKEIIEDVAERSVKKRVTQGERETVRDLEIALRVRLRTQELLFQQIYLDALKDWRVMLQKRSDAMLAEEKEIATIIAILL